jgi:23S rRNA (guanosine2251-2'-O)-methyltransferase
MPRFLPVLHPPDLDAGRKLSTAELVSEKPTPEAFAQLPRQPIFVVCDNIRSLANVGLIFRLCDAIRAERLYLCGITGYPPTEGDSRPPWVAERAGRVIAKTAIHTVQFVPWEYRPSAIDVVRELKERGCMVVALEQTTDSVPYTQVEYQFPICLVVGHERAGIEDPILALTDVAVEIPMFGMGNSLNVAMALGICAYEVIRRCSQDED